MMDEEIFIFKDNPFVRFSLQFWFTVIPMEMVDNKYRRYGKPSGLSSSCLVMNLFGIKEGEEEEEEKNLILNNFI